MIFGQEGDAASLKIMRYRIRLLALALVLALFAVLLWGIRAAWFPSAPSAAPSGPVSLTAPEATASPEAPSAPSESPSAEPTVSPEPLFDTYGL